MVVLTNSRSVHPTFILAEAPVLAFEEVVPNANVRNVDAWIWRLDRHGRGGGAEGMQVSVNQLRYCKRSTVLFQHSLVV